MEKLLRPNDFLTVFPISHWIAFMAKTSPFVRLTFVRFFCAMAAVSSAACAQEFHLPGLIFDSKELLLLQRRELAEMKEMPITYEVRQTIQLDEITVGAKEVLIWISIPSDESNQKLLSVAPKEIPGDWQIVEDADRRGKFLFSRITDPATTTLTFEIEYRLSRSPTFTKIDADRVRPLSDLERSMMSEYLAKDSLHMEVTDKVQAIADDICGDEQNIGLQSIAIMKHIAQSSDHYSYSTDPKMPRCGVGDAKNCLAQGGGCCTDLNSLFIALARARGIPARLNMGYRLLEENVGQSMDPGYRCWVEYFVPGYGWVSADVVEADAPDGKGQVRWLTGLTPRRVWLNQGRQFRFKGAHASEAINHMNIAYAEVDGKPARVLPDGELAPQLKRRIYFSVLSSPEGSDHNSASPAASIREP